MELLGKIFGTESKADKLVSYIDEQKKEISSRTAGIKEEDKPSVYICGLGNWGTTNHLMTAQNYISFNIANVKNAVSGLAKNGIQQQLRISSHCTRIIRPCLIHARHGRMVRFTLKWHIMRTTLITR